MCPVYLWGTRLGIILVLQFVFSFRMNVWDKLYIRDFLIACLMVIGGGHRSDVIRNMTLEEWNDRKIEEGEDEENQVQFNC